MRTADDFTAIRRAHRDGISIRQLARQPGVRRGTVREAPHDPEPKPYTSSRPRPARPPSARSARSPMPSSTPTRPPRASSDTPPPRSSAGCAPSTATPAAMTRSVATSRRAAGTAARPSSRWTTRLATAPRPTSATSTPTSPTDAAQVPVLLVTRSYSNCPFAIALPTERTEAVLHGLAEAFAFFGCVPHKLWRDNPAPAPGRASDTSPTWHGDPGLGAEGGTGSNADHQEKMSYWDTVDFTDRSDVGCHWSLVAGLDHSVRPRGRGKSVSSTRPSVRARPGVCTHAPSLREALYA
jgi:hypothetical protein